MLASKLDPFLKRFEELNSLLSSSDILNDISKMTTLSKEQKNLEPIVLKAKEYLKTLDNIEENKALLNDPELGELAKEELKTLEELKPKLEEEIKFYFFLKIPMMKEIFFLKFVQVQVAMRHLYL